MDAKEEAVSVGTGPMNHIISKFADSVLFPQVLVLVQELLGAVGVLKILHGHEWGLVAVFFGRHLHRASTQKVPEV